MQDIRFVIYENSYIIRKGLADIIEKIPNTKLHQQFDNKEEFIDNIEACEADIIIINQDLLEIKNISEKLNNIEDFQVIVLTTNDKNNLPPQVKHAGIINLFDSQKEILKQLNSVVGNKTESKNKSEKPEEISNREADILKYIAMGFSNKEIADKLFLSTHTVVTHRKNITRKLGIKTVPGLTIYAILNKIIDINETEKI